MRRISKNTKIIAAIVAVLLIAGAIFYYMQPTDNRCSRPGLTAVDHCDGYWQKAFNY